MAETMMGAILPGNSTVELREFPIPTPGHGQVLVKTMASTICGSDIRCIYREHTGKGAEGYIPGTIAGHEPCGQIVAEGTPEEVAANPASFTGQYLGPILKRDRVKSGETGQE